MILEGDCRDRLRELPERSVQTVVTSPPYFGLRDYGTGEWEGGDPDCRHGSEPWTEDSGDLGHRDSVLSANVAKSHRRSKGLCRTCGATRKDSQIGLEPTPDEFVAALVEVFREVRRVLRDDGTVWLVLGDSYAANMGGAMGVTSQRKGRSNVGLQMSAGVPAGLKPKDLIGIPWMVAFALRADGWYLRSDIIWSKPNPMPESVTDRPTKAHEYLFLLSKGPRYFYDADAVREVITSEVSIARNRSTPRQILGAAARQPGGDPTYRERENLTEAGRNKRSVWTVDYNGTEWIGKIGFCRVCGGLRVAGNGSDPTTEQATDASSATTSSVAPIGSPTSTSSGQSQTDSRSTISAETSDASTQNTSSLLPHERTSCEGIRSSLETSPRPNATTGTPSTSRTPMLELTVDGNAVPACECEHGDTGQRRSVWQIATQPYAGAHFATFPPKLIEPCILAGARKGDVVLDPFAGAGTTGVVAGYLEREFVGIELNPEYAAMAEKRILAEGRPGNRNHDPVKVHADQLGLEIG